VFSYDVAADTADVSTTGPFGLRSHPGVMPGWDNTARRGSAGYVFHGGNPSSFRRWLARAVRSAASSRDGLVLVNAWNEWAEGAHIEPDSRFGRGYLEAVQDVLGPARADRSLASGWQIDLTAGGRQEPVDVADGRKDTA
jgi:hypothetical protein